MPNNNRSDRYEVIADIDSEVSVILWYTASYFEAIEMYIGTRNATGIFDRETGNRIA